MEDQDKANVVRRPAGPIGQATGARAMGDPATWVDEHGDALFRYALLRVRERASAEDVVQETYGAPGAADPARIVLRRGRGVRRAREVDTVEAALVGVCDGELSLAQALDALAELLGHDPAVLRADYPAIIRGLVEEGWLGW